MSYCYEIEKPSLFTESGIAIVISVRDKAFKLIDAAGACTSGKLMQSVSASTWTVMAALDYLVDRGELSRVTPVDGTRGQDQVFVTARV